MNDMNRPTWSKSCNRCSATVERWRGEGDVSCRNCGASYNCSGQELRDEWRENRSWIDEDVDDLVGFELAALRRELG